MLFVCGIHVRHRQRDAVQSLVQCYQNSPPGCETILRYKLVDWALVKVVVVGGRRVVLCCSHMKLFKATSFECKESNCMFWNIPFWPCICTCQAINNGWWWRCTEDTVHVPGSTPRRRRGDARGVPQNCPLQVRMHNLPHGCIVESVLICSFD